MINHGQEIRKFFEGDVDDSAETLEKYSRDASIFTIVPKLVLYPKSAEDIKKLVAYVSEAQKNGEDLSLTARSAATDMTGGPISDSIIVDVMRYLNHLGEIGANFVYAEPGVYYRDFEKATLYHELLLPTYPASRELCAVGGMVANNAGGEKTLVFGKTADYVSELAMIASDGNSYIFKKLTKEELASKKEEQTFEGEIYRKMHELIEKNYEKLIAAKPDVTKNSSGYALWDVYDPAQKTFDLTRVIVGSQGTLGIITNIKFRLIKPKPKSRLLVVFLQDLSFLGDLSKLILMYKPESFESYDDNTFRLAIKFFPEILHQIKGSLLRLALSLIPAAVLIFRTGIPKLALLAEFTGDTTDEADELAKRAEKEIRKAYPKIKMRITKSDEETEEYWLIRRESFNLLRHHVRGLRTAPFIDDFSVRADKLSEFLPALYEILAKYKLLYTVAGHIGDGNFHIIPLMDFNKPDTKEVIARLSKEVYGLVFKYKGSTTGEHNDGLIRGPYLKEQYGEDVYNLFVETKKIFDPQNVFNPGKKVGVTLEDSLKYLDTKM